MGRLGAAALAAGACAAVLAAATAWLFVLHVAHQRVPGGAIMIHGQPDDLGWLARYTRASDWTDGCIAVSNRAIEELWDAVPVGTPITIRP